MGVVSKALRVLESASPEGRAIFSLMDNPAAIARLADALAEVRPELATDARETVKEVLLTAWRKELR